MKGKISALLHKALRDPKARKWLTHLGGKGQLKIDGKKYKIVASSPSK